MFLWNSDNHISVTFLTDGASHIQTIESDQILPIRDPSNLRTGMAQIEAKTKLVQQQLALILHSHKCSRKDNENALSGRQVSTYLNLLLLRFEKQFRNRLYQVIVCEGQ